MPAYQIPITIFESRMGIPRTECLKNNNFHNIYVFLLNFETIHLNAAVSVAAASAITNAVRGRVATAK